MSPPLEAFADFGTVAPIERASDVQAPIPHEVDGFDRILSKMQTVFNQTGDERLALAHGLDQLCDEITPCIRSPRGAGERPPSRKAKRRVIAAIRHFMAQGERT